MFDWDDQELANIIWGEGREAGDHIVPYAEDIRKKILSDYGDNDQKTLIQDNTKSEAAENDTSTSELFLNGSERDKNDNPSASGAVVDTQLDLSSFIGSKSDDSGIDKKSQLDAGPEPSRSHHEDKELGDLVGNSWTSIGSFDDLDRIFSNDDIDGNTSLGSTDELWTSPKDLISGAVKSSSAALGLTNWEFGALGNCSSNIDINSEFLHNGNSSVSNSIHKDGSISPYPHQTIGRHMEQNEYAEGSTGLVEDKTSVDSHIAAEIITSSNMPTEKEKWFGAQSKYELATDRVPDSRLLRDVYGTWPSASENVTQSSFQCAPTRVQNFPASVPTQQQLSQEFKPVPYQHFPASYDAPYEYGTFTNQYPVMCMLKHTEDEHQSIISSSDVSPGDVISLNKPVETTTKPKKMTPQEKIEKLRRRQQMRAMLAIQKQQERLGHQASSGDYPHSHKICLDDHVEHMEKSDLEADEIISTLPCYGPGSPNKGDDSSTISNVDDFSVEDTVLYQLQDIISRLDMKIRLCMRDSLYRLAQSATQRHYSSDTSSKRSSTYAPGIIKEETDSHDRLAGNVNMETETNHIDRVVAHLLFHRPLKLSVRHAETPESSTSTKLTAKQETAALNSPPAGLLAKSSENEYNSSPHGSKSPHNFMESHEEDVSNYVSQKEMRISPQMEQMTSKHTD